MKIEEVAGVGKIVKGVNTTVDIKPGETQRQAAKFGNKVDAQGRPPELHKKARKNSKPGTLYNMGLVNEEIKQSEPLTVLDNLASRRDNDAFPVKMYDGSVTPVRPSSARRILSIYLNGKKETKEHIRQALKTKNGFKELLRKVESIKFDDKMLAEVWSPEYKVELMESAKSN